MLSRSIYLILCSIIVVALYGCSSVQKQKDDYLVSKEQQLYKNTGHLIRKDALIVGRNKHDSRNVTMGIGVNAYLWRSSLDSISFMPLRAADPFGGVIITDWYSPPQTPNERIKVDILILDRRLRVDGIKVSIFKQELDVSNVWRGAKINPKSPQKLENVILTRARKMRIDSQH
jgi:hypothetical protein